MTEPYAENRRARLQPVVDAELARGNRIKHGWHVEQFDIHWGSEDVLDLARPLDLDALATEVELPPGARFFTGRDGSNGVADENRQISVVYRAPTPPPPPPTRRQRVWGRLVGGYVLLALVVAGAVELWVFSRVARDHYVGGGAFKAFSVVGTLVFVLEIALLVVLHLVAYALWQAGRAVLSRRRKGSGGTAAG